MKKKFKKIFAVAAATVLSVFSFAGCGEGNSPTNTDKNTFVYLSSWTREGVGTHLYSGANIGPLN